MSGLDGLSIVIPFFKRLACLKLILNELAKQSAIIDKPIELLIVDSYSCEDLPSYLDSINTSRFPIRLIQCVNTISAKRNKGADNASFGFIAFLDDDCIPKDLYLASLFDVIMHVDDQTIISGTVSFDKRLCRASAYINYRQWLLNKHPRRLLKYCDPWNAYSMNFVASKRLFESIRFDESIVLYGCEDPAFFHQCNLEGFKIANGNFSITHVESNGFSRYMEKNMTFGCSLSILKNKYSYMYSRLGDRAKVLEYFQTYFFCNYFILSLTRNFLTCLAGILERLDKFSFLIHPLIFHSLALAATAVGFSLKKNEVKFVYIKES